MGGKVVITGGIGSGKSAKALEIAHARPQFSDRVFIATATAFDDEMKEKIRRHKQERGEEFRTVEEPLDVADALGQFSENPRCCAIVDCLTVWLCNLFQTAYARRRSMKDDFISAFGNFRGLLIVVTNETGMGIVPPEKQTRDYASELASLNKRVVSLCDEAYLLVAGAPVQIK